MDNKNSSDPNPEIIDSLTFDENGVLSVRLVRMDSDGAMANTPESIFALSGTEDVKALVAGMGVLSVERAMKLYQDLGRFGQITISIGVEIQPSTGEGQDSILSGVDSGELEAALKIIKAIKGEKTNKLGGLLNSNFLKAPSFDPQKKVVSDDDSKIIHDESSNIKEGDKKKGKHNRFHSNQAKTL